MDLRNKVAIITGSAQGLGKAFASRLLEVLNILKICSSKLTLASLIHSFVEKINANDFRLGLEFVFLM